jgi:hypothetical protein
MQAQQQQQARRKGFHTAAVTRGGSEQSPLIPRHIAATSSSQTSSQNALDPQTHQHRPRCSPRGHAPHEAQPTSEDHSRRWYAKGDQGKRGQLQPGRRFSRRWHGRRTHRQLDADPDWRQRARSGSLQAVRPSPMTTTKRALAVGQNHPARRVCSHQTRTSRTRFEAANGSPSRSLLGGGWIRRSRCWSVEQSVLGCSPSTVKSRFRKLWSVL